MKGQSFILPQQEVKARDSAHEHPPGFPRTSVQHVKERKAALYQKLTLHLNAFLLMMKNYKRTLLLSDANGTFRYLQGEIMANSVKLK